MRLPVRREREILGVTRPSYNNLRGVRAEIYKGVGGQDISLRS